MSETQGVAELTDEQLLHRMGYAQELRRRLSGFTNFAISFTIISILAGTLTSYYIGFGDGGPIIMSWGWPFVAFMCLFVALAMAELASAMPTAGGLYYWSSKIGSPAWGWFTGWLNIIGFTIGTAAVGWGAAVFMVALGNLLFPGVVHTTNGTIFLFYSIILVAGGIINTFGISPIRFLSNLSAWWHMLGVAIVAGVLVVVPSHHQSAAFVFTKTINASGFGGHGFSSPVFWFVIGLGLLQAQYTIGGYDASAHMSEETRSASRKAARGVWTSVAVSGVFGWILLLALTFAVPNVTGTLAAGAFDVQYIWQDSLGVKWAEFLLFIVVAAQFFCDTAGITSSSRIIWALSRDKAVPGHRFWRRLNRRRAPAYTIWLVVVFDIAWMLPTFADATIGYLVATSITVIALYSAYALPIFLRLRLGAAFQPGAWTLGRHYRWVDSIALAWIVAIAILFIMPVTPTGIPFHQGFTWTVVNYAPLTLAAALLLFGGWWLLSARHWFRGPVRQASFEELEAADQAPGVGLVAADTAALEIAARLWPGAPVTLEELPGGLTNLNYKATTPAGAYVIRLFCRDGELLAIDRDVERAAASMAAQLGIGPEVVAYAPREGYLVTRFLRGQQITADQMRSPGTLARVAATLRVLHDGRSIPGTIDPFTVVDFYRDNAVARGADPGEEYAWAKPMASRIKRAVSFAPATPCHGDLLAANFIDHAGQIYLVDWEYAGMGDPRFELANFSVNHGFGIDEDRELVRLYYGEPDQRLVAAVRVLRFMSAFREAMWSVLQQAISDLHVDFGAYTREQFARMRATVSGAEFRAALELLESAASPDGSSR